jgi:hypothetical protein
MVKVSIELRLIKGWFYPCRTVLEHSTHNSKIQTFKPHAGIGREKMVKNELKRTVTSAVKL